MKKSLLVLGLILATFSVAYAHQSTGPYTTDVTITIYLHYHTSVTVSPANLVWGSETSPIDTNVNYVSASSVSVRNDSPHFAASIMRVSLHRITVPGNVGWSWGTTLGDRGIERAVLLGAFAPARPDFGAYAGDDVITDGAKDWMMGGAFDPGTGGYPTTLGEATGAARWLVSVNAGGTGASPGFERGLWFALQTPTASRLVNPRTVTVRVTGSALLAP